MPSGATIPPVAGAAGWRWSFKAKVILPVILIIAVLAGFMMVLFSNRLERQIEDEGTDRLRTAQSVFRELQRIRGQNLLLQHRSLTAEPRFKAVAQLGDAPTMRFQLEELAGAIGADAAFYATASGTILTGVSRSPEADYPALADRSAASIRSALAREPTFSRIQFQARLYEIACLPVEVAGGVVGVLAVATHIGNSTMEEFKRLTHAELAVVAGSRVLVSSLGGTDQLEAIAQVWRARARGHLQGQAPTEAVLLGGEHFRMLPEPFAIANSEEDAQCLLLCSYEQSLGELRSIQRLFLLALVLGLAASSALVYAVVGRLTAPLRLLRNGALEVARGEFTGALEIHTRDECGELAWAFNHMKSNLRESHAALAARQRDLALACEEAQAASRAKSEFFATISHELRTPLNGILGMTTLLLETRLDTEQRDFAATIGESGDRLLGIITDILDFSRIDTGQESLHLEEIQIHLVAEEVISSLRAGAHSKGLELRFEAPPSFPGPLQGDARRIREVIFKLVGNAIKFTEAGHVRLTLELVAETPLQAQVRMEISDTGIGIPEAIQPRLFQPFTQADGSHTRRHGGTGLGLAICKRLVELMGGGIGLRSAEGAGSTFWVVLPLLKSTPSRHPGLVTESPRLSP